MMETALKIDNLRKSYGKHKVLKEINLEVYKGEIFGILGANGAGKSTTLECIEGVKSFTSGSIKVFGQDISKNKEVQKNIGVQLQSSGIQDNMTVIEAMTFFCIWQNISVRLDLLDSFGLKQHYKRQYGQLSTGQKRRLHLALAICNEPKIVILDEPTAGLDVEGRIELHSEIRKLKERGITVILASHDMAEVEMLCDRLAVIVKGEIKFTGTVREFKLRGNNEKKVKVKTINQSLIDQKFNQTQLYDGNSGYITVSTTNLTKSLSEIIEEIERNEDEIEDLVIECLSLEERFMEMVYEKEEVKASESISV